LGAAAWNWEQIWFVSFGYGEGGLRRQVEKERVITGSCWRWWK
jgi:hypothetical protein